MKERKREIERERMNGEKKTERQSERKREIQTMNMDRHKGQRKRQ